MKFTAIKSIVITIALSMLSIFFQPLAFSAEKKKIEYEDDDVMFRVYRRSPKQIAAFYEGRGFSHEAIDEIEKYCSIAVIVKNKTSDVLWLELDNWQFTSKGKQVSRINRDYWKKLWEKTNLPQAHRATFGWTLMPEARDLQKDEGVGGSIPLPMLTEPFSITARFSTGENKGGNIKTVTVENITCKADEN